MTTPLKKKSFCGLPRIMNDRGEFKINKRLDQCSGMAVPGGGGLERPSAKPMDRHNGQLRGMGEGDDGQ